MLWVLLVGNYAYLCPSLWIALLKISLSGLELKPLITYAIPFFFQKEIKERKEEEWKRKKKRKKCEWNDWHREYHLWKLVSLLIPLMVNYGVNSNDCAVGLELLLIAHYLAVSPSFPNHAPPCLQPQTTLQSLASPHDWHLYTWLHWWRIESLAKTMVVCMHLGWFWVIILPLNTERSVLTFTHIVRTYQPA